MENCNLLPEPNCVALDYTPRGYLVQCTTSKLLHRSNGERRTKAIRRRKGCLAMAEQINNWVTVWSCEWNMQARKQACSKETRKYKKRFQINQQKLPFSQQPGRMCEGKSRERARTAHWKLEAKLSEGFELSSGADSSSRDRNASVYLNLFWSGSHHLMKSVHWSCFVSASSVRKKTKIKIPAAGNSTIRVRGEIFSFR